MKRAIHIAAIVLTFAMMPAVASPPAHAQQVQGEPQKQTLKERLKAKYHERRAQFMQRVKDAYFAVGCKVLAREAGIMPLTSSESYLAYIGEQTIVDTREDEAARQAAIKEGLDRAAKPGECDYYRTHPEAAEAIRRAAREAQQAAQQPAQGSAKK